MAVVDAGVEEHTVVDQQTSAVHGVDAPLEDRPGDHCRGKVTTVQSSPEQTFVEVGAGKIGSGEDRNGRQRHILYELAALEQDACRVIVRIGIAVLDAGTSTGVERDTREGAVACTGIYLDGRLLDQFGAQGDRSAVRMDARTDEVDRFGQDQWRRRAEGTPAEIQPIICLDCCDGVIKCEEYLGCASSGGFENDPWQLSEGRIHSGHAQCDQRKTECRLHRG